MLLLTSTSDKIQLVTGAAVSTIDVHVSWVDNNAGTITPGRLNTVISTATTTDIVPSPGSGVQRNVKGIYITNTSGSTSTQVTVLHTDGTTTADIMGVNLLGGENLCYREDGSWVHRDWNGAEYGQSTTYDPWSMYGVAGSLAESVPRMILPEANLAALTSGTLFLQGIYLRAGMKVSQIAFCSATTAASTPTNCFFALYDANRVLRGQTANQLTAAWAANTLKTLPLTAAYTIPSNGLYYCGIMVTATTVPTIKGMTAKTANQLAATDPRLHGTSTASLTTSLPDPAAAITTGNNVLWCAVY